MLDTLLERYGSADYIMSLPLDEGLYLASYAMEQKADERLWQRWLTLLPWTSEEKQVSFEDFKANEKRLSHKSTRTEKEIIALAQEARQRLQPTPE